MKSRKTRQMDRQITRQWNSDPYVSVCLWKQNKKKTHTTCFVVFQTRLLRSMKGLTQVPEYSVKMRQQS